MKLGMGATWATWTQELHKELIGLPDSGRYREFLDITYFDRACDLAPQYGLGPKVMALSPEHSAIIAQGLLVDPSQSIAGKTVGPKKRKVHTDDEVGTLTQQSCVYSFELDRCFKGVDHVALQGLPVSYGSRSLYDLLK